MNGPKVDKSTTKTCFVIAPIGGVGTEIRIRSDKVLKHIVAPAAIECGYAPVLEPTRYRNPGIITSQVIQHIVEDPLVIADLTGPNANVFYELAIRHAFRMPVVQIIDAAEPIPFDVAASRTIAFDYRDLDSAESARKEIARQIRAVEKSRDVDNPLTVAVELQSLRKSDNPLEKSAADIMAMLSELMGAVNEIQRNTRTEPVSAWTFNPVAGKGKSGWITGTDLVDPAALRQFFEMHPTANPTKPDKPEKGK